LTYIIYIYVSGIRYSSTGLGLGLVELRTAEDKPKAFNSARLWRKTML